MGLSCAVFAIIGDIGGKRIFLYLPPILNAQLGLLHLVFVSA